MGRRRKKKMPVLFSCEEFKILKVIGEEVVQVVSEQLDCLDTCVKDIIDITFDLVDINESVFTNKIVQQGIIRKKIIFCTLTGDVRCQFVDTPFTAIAEIPGIEPKEDLEIQNKVLLTESDYRLIDSQTLSVKVVFEILFKASKFVQRKLQVCNTNVLSVLQVSN